ncbi:hypothetical protein MXD62_15535 [Frankia sp. Mgl5]|uniref:hypothetical protein n=1 Tax=Frankia sp. Mgl5 TaxID=2933793 RepID=UPI00200C703E|nr:hypothetical protein [Frankia sp. Mgl5]MCK9928568.1 hypothetical protein [Frankia sp. Mgl5]
MPADPGPPSAQSSSEGPEAVRAPGKPEPVEPADDAAAVTASGLPPVSGPSAGVPPSGHQPSDEAPSGDPPAEHTPAGDPPAADTPSVDGPSGEEPPREGILDEDPLDGSPPDDGAAADPSAADPADPTASTGSADSTDSADPAVSAGPTTFVRPTSSAGPAPSAGPAEPAGDVPGDGSPPGGLGRSVIRLLDRVDAAALPPVGRVLESVAGGLAGARDRPRARLRRAWAARGGPYVDGDGPPPSGRASVITGRALEAIGRLLVLGLVVLIVVGAVTTMLRGADPSGSHVPGPGPGNAPAGPVEPTVTVGPAAGESPAAYAAEAEAKLDGLTRAAPDADLYAVVSLAGYRTPGEMLQIFTAYRTLEVFFGVPPDGAVMAATVRDPVADLTAAFDSEADAADTRAHSATDPAEAEHARQEATALRARCGCLFGAVVRAPAARLVDLGHLEGVRVVDPAPPGISPETVRFLPLQPDQR